MRIAMVAPQRKRYVCPLCGTAVLSPSRMAKDDVRRFCLRCSERTGKLVARVSPVLERQRRRSKERTAKKAATKRHREAPKRKLAADVRKRVREHHRDRTASHQTRVALLATRTASTEHNSASLRQLGYTVTGYRDELRRAGVTLLQASVNSGALWAPKWAHELLALGTATATRGSAIKMIRHLVRDEKSHAALRAAMATGDLIATVCLALDLYPFPVARALGDAIRGDDA